MKSKQNCSSCKEKNSILKVFTIKNYLLKKINNTKPNGIEHEKEIWSHKELALFYICKKCCTIADFRLANLPSNIKFWLHVIPKDDNEKLKQMKSRSSPPCIYCKFDRNPPNVGKKDSQPVIIKFFLEGKREFFGYRCNICQRSYIKLVDGIKWENIKEWNAPLIWVNVLDNAIKYYPQKEIETEKGYKKRLESTKNFVEFKKIGEYEITASAPIGDNFIYHSIGFPKRTEKRYLKSLKKGGCKINEY